MIQRDLINSDRIKTLETALEDALREIVNNDSKIESLETEVKSLNERAIALDCEDVTTRFYIAINRKLVKQIEENNIEIATLKQVIEYERFEHREHLKGFATLLRQR